MDMKSHKKITRNQDLIYLIELAHTHLSLDICCEFILIDDANAWGFSTKVKQLT